MRGINIRNSEPYWPSRNGLVERRNSTLKAMSRSLLVQAGLPFEFWARSIYTACYTMNRLPTKRLHGRTPFEAMHGRAPNLSHMRVFGSVCYPLNVIKNSKSMVTAPPHIFAAMTTARKAMCVSIRLLRSSRCVLLFSSMSPGDAARWYRDLQFGQMITHSLSILNFRTRQPLRPRRPTTRLLL